MYKIIAAVLGISLLIGMAPAWAQKETVQPGLIPVVFDEERELPGMTAEERVLPGMTAYLTVFHHKFVEAAGGPKPVNI